MKRQGKSLQLRLDQITESAQLSRPEFRQFHRGKSEGSSTQLVLSLWQFLCRPAIRLRHQGLGVHLKAPLKHLKNTFTSESSDAEGFAKLGPSQEDYLFSFGKKF